MANQIPTPSHDNERPAVTDQLVAALCAEADVVPRSVERRLAGLPVRGRPGKRIDAALARRGLISQ